MKKIKSGRIGYALIAAAAVLVAAGVWTIATGKKTIPLTEIVRAEFSGYSGWGTTNGAGLDADLLVEKYGRSLELTREGKKRYPDPLTPRAKAQIIADLVTIAFDDHGTEGLSNGDLVTMTVSAQPELTKLFRADFKGGRITVRVSGLREALRFDAFAGVELYLPESVSGYATPRFRYVKNNYSDWMSRMTNAGKPVEIQVLTLDGEPAWEMPIANGDVRLVRFTATPEDCVSVLGAVPYEMEREITITGMNEELSFDRLTDDDLEPLWEKAIEAVNKAEEGEELRREGMFLIRSYGGYAHCLCLVLSRNITFEAKENIPYPPEGYRPPVYTKRVFYPVLTPNMNFQNGVLAKTRGFDMGHSETRLYNNENRIDLVSPLTAGWTNPYIMVRKMIGTYDPSEITAADFGEGTALYAGEQKPSRMEEIPEDLLEYLFANAKKEAVRAFPSAEPNIIGHAFLVPHQMQGRVRCDSNRHIVFLRMDDGEGSFWCAVTTLGLVTYDDGSCGVSAHVSATASMHINYGRLLTGVSEPDNILFVLRSDDPVSLIRERTLDLSDSCRVELSEELKAILGS